MRCDMEFVVMAVIEFEEEAMGHDQSVEVIGLGLDDDVTETELVGRN
jgi:hypothetical protein